MSDADREPDIAPRADAIRGSARSPGSTRLEAEMSALASLGAATGRARSVGEVAAAALDILCRATAADAGLVTSMEETYEAAAARDVDPRTIEVILSFGQLGGPLARALEPADAVIAADVATGPLREDVREALMRDGIRRIVVVGLHVSGQLTGLLALGWRRPPDFEPSAGILLQAAALVAGALANARLIAEILRDQTERSRMQAELIQAQKMEAIGLLVAGVAHELNNPLAAIVAFSQLIRTDPALPPDLRAQASLLVEEANRTRTIVGNLLDFARQRPPERVEQSLRPIVDSVLLLQSYLLGRSDVAVDIDIPADLPPVSIDRSQFQQVLVNLTVNAIHAIRSTGRPGRIGITATTDDATAHPTDEPAAETAVTQHVRIAIADDGPGVPAEVADRLFLPFVTTKPPGEGTGLGLSVSFGIVSAHGGTLRHAPTPGGGATFVIELPVSQAAEPKREPTAAPSRSSAGTPAADRARQPGATQRVLVLDDEPAIRAFLIRILSREGWVPVVASDGAAALEIVRRDPPDAIICDYRMAGMTGTEFHDAVSGISPSLARRFAFMSGDVLNPELREFAALRGVHLLAKPFDIADAADVIRELLAVETA